MASPPMTVADSGSTGAPEMSWYQMESPGSMRGGTGGRGPS
jgi:hypothetical protein